MGLQNNWGVKHPIKDIPWWIWLYYYRYTTLDVIYLHEELTSLFGISSFLHTTYHVKDFIIMWLHFFDKPPHPLPLIIFIALFWFLYLVSRVKWDLIIGYWNFHASWFDGDFFTLTLFVVLFIIMSTRVFVFPFISHLLGIGIFYIYVLYILSPSWMIFSLVTRHLYHSRILHYFLSVLSSHKLYFNCIDNNISLS